MLNANLDTWIAALEERHLADLTRQELTRGLRALSSCYVERRGQLGRGAALDGAGKRAAFALFYGPMHFLTIGEILKALGAAQRPPRTIHDLGCGSGVGGAAWATACDGQPAIEGVDRSAWAVAEANWAYRALGLRGRARRADALDAYPRRIAPDTAIVVAYAANELTPAERDELLVKLADSGRQGARFLIVEPIARRDRPWWPEWAAALRQVGAREDEWRFTVVLPATLQQFAKAAGLDPRQLTARSIAKI